jgi:serine/threonine-protein kinase
LGASPSLIGRTYGSYRLRSRLGQGGMGQVYRADHPDPAKRAAVKVLLPHLCERTQVVGRFFNEAKAASRIKHAGIVEIYDYGTNEDGSAYIAMEYLEGESLGARITRGRLPFDLTLELAGQVAGALAAAHREGIIHRDLKPDNIFLVADPSLPHKLRIKLLDFGIAKLAEGSEVEATRAGLVMGTPRYMAPEQTQGAGGVDRTADLYALGCIVYEMISGRPPFLETSPGEVMAAHILEDAQPLRELVPDVPAALADAVTKAMEKTPAKRFQSAIEMARAMGAPPASVAASPRPSRSPPPAARGVTQERAQTAGPARTEGQEAAARLLRRLQSVKTAPVASGPPLYLVVGAALLLAAAVAMLFAQIGRRSRPPVAPPASTATATPS